ncbi:MAG TPA: hypothetical protein VN943_05745 [Candidatus Acidoferrum sp.]|nr:hypothetical protein [Candidatus Acidoferrum sp.]
MPRKQEESVPPQAVSPNFPVDAAPWRIATGTHPFGDLFKHEKGDEAMETQNETTNDLVSAILDQHERELFDDELEGE